MKWRCRGRPLGVRKLHLGRLDWCEQHWDFTAEWFHQCVIFWSDIHQAVHCFCKDLWFSKEEESKQDPMWLVPHQTLRQDRVKAVRPCLPNQQLVIFFCPCFLLASLLPLTSLKVEAWWRNPGFKVESSVKEKHTDKKQPLLLVGFFTASLHFSP